MIYLIRHAESIANSKGIYQGQTYDVSLSQRGIKQAKAISRAFNGIKIDKIYTSPLRRCVETAQLVDISIKRIIEQNKIFKEINHGTWEGKRIDDFSKKEKEVLEKWRTKPHLTQMIEGENFSDVVKRCKKILKKFEALEGNFVLVTHDTILRILILLTMKIDFNNFWKFQLDNCGITKIQTHPLRLISLNETAHLNGLKTSLGKQAL